LCYLLLLYGLYGLILTISAFRIHKMVAAKWKLK
jgi:hypothetical protein